MSLRLLPVLPALALLSLAAPADAIDIYESDDGETAFAFTGYAQPYVRWVDSPCTYNAEGTCTRSRVPDGFGLTRARVAFEGRHGMTDFKVELRTIPNVELLALRLRFDVTDGFTVTAGRFRVPFSRQELISESRLQLIDRASHIKATPGRQLGAAVTLTSDLFRRSRLPDEFLRLDLGVFNGESAKERAPVNNIDENFLYAARLALSPLGAIDFAEGDVRPIGDRHQARLSVGANATWEQRGPANGDYVQRNIGADMTLHWRGFSLYGEYFTYARNFEDDVSNPDLTGRGFNAQLGAFVPAPYVRERLELAARVQQWDPTIAVSSDRDDEVLSPLAGSGPARGDADTASSTQAHRDYVVGLNWYFRGHDLKLQANYTWRTEIEDFILSAQSELVPPDVDDNSFFLQLTYRF